MECVDWNVVLGQSNNQWLCHSDIRHFSLFFFFFCRTWLQTLLSDSLLGGGEGLGKRRNGISFRDWVNGRPEWNVVLGQSNNQTNDDFVTLDDRIFAVYSKNPSNPHVFSAKMKALIRRYFKDCQNTKNINVLCFQLFLISVSDKLWWIDHLIDWFTASLFNRSNDWLLDRLIDWLVDSLICSFIDWLIQWLLVC